MGLGEGGEAERFARRAWDRLTWTRLARGGRAMAIMASPRSRERAVGNHLQAHTHTQHTHTHMAIIVCCCLPISHLRSSLQLRPTFFQAFSSLLLHPPFAPLPTPLTNCIHLWDLRTPPSLYHAIHTFRVSFKDRPSRTFPTPEDLPRASDGGSPSPSKKSEAEKNWTRTSLRAGVLAVQSTEKHLEVNQQ